MLQLEGELEKSVLENPDLDLAVDKGLSVAANISKIYIPGTFDKNQKLQYLLFPKGVSYSKENERLRTKRVNELFREISIGKRIEVEKEKGNLRKDCLFSVPRTSRGSNFWVQDVYSVAGY